MSLNKRLDPTQDIRTDKTWVDMGDKASTYVFTGAVNHFSVGGGNKSQAHTRLKEIAATSDNKWGSDFDTSDGGNRQRLEFTNADGTVADDFMALLAEAMEGDEGITLTKTEAGAIEITVEGRWSNDILRFEGDFLEDALCELAAQDPSGYAAHFGNSTVDLGDGHEQIGVYQFDLDKNESAYWSHDKATSDEVTALFDKTNAFFQDENAVALVEAALDEKYGLGDTDGLQYLGDDGEAITIALKTDREPVDKLVLHGTEIAATIDGYKSDLGTGINPQDSKSQTAYYNTDANAGGKGSVWVGSQSDKVTFDSAETITLKAVVGNGINQVEDNANRAWQDDIDEFVFSALSNTGQSDVEVGAGGDKGDDFVTVAMKASQGQTDTVILEGERVGDAIDHYADTGTQFDFFA